MSEQTVSYLWREPQAPKGFSAGVSLHSHTNQSQETLDFIAELSTEWKFLQPFLRWCEERCQKTSGIRVDYAHSYWTPPLTPKLAYELEQKQIEKLDMAAMVSLSDHDDIKAPMLLRHLEETREIPVSLEWTVPFGETTFHIGIHNLPGEKAQEWAQRLAAFTAIPVIERRAKLLAETLSELDSIPGVLIVFNHPLWDLYRIGNERHRFQVNEFLAQHGQFCHALELNGLRHWDENREVATLAERWNQVLISGGDRHGIEPNANINLTRATSFNEFVHEVRRERISHVLYMPQYKEPWKHRILNSTLDAIRDYPDFPEGSKRWDERVYHPDENGQPRALSSMWSDGHAPSYLRIILSGVKLLGRAPVSGGLRLAWNDTAAMRNAMAQHNVEA